MPAGPSAERATGWDAPVSPEDATHFRPDIEGLRGIAVLAVLAYHARLPYAGGGFVGVDVFFVISGFLITGLLLRELRGSGRIDLPSFYARRARRLLPAALIVIAVTAFASWLILSPLRFADVGADGAAAALYVSNYRFAFAELDYFAARDSASPLLHYWSLGVEEQFYLVWPALLLVSRRLKGTRLALLLGGIGLASLVASLIVTQHEAPLAFYSLPTRAWQLAIGAVLAIAVMRARGPLHPILASALGVLGLALIGGSVSVISESTVYPGTAAIFPAVGAALVVGAGSDRGAIMAKALAIRPLRWVGRISYSLYLWHWPLLILVPLVIGRAGLGFRLLLALASIAIAALSTRFIEEPFRIRWPAWIGAGRTLGIAGGSSVAIAAVVLLGSGALHVVAQASNPLPTLPPVTSSRPTLPPAVTEGPIPANLQPSLLEARNDRRYLDEGGCQPRITDPTPVACEFGNPSSSTVVVVFGDSHAAMWVPAVKPITDERGWKLITLVKPGCTPVRVTVWRQQLQRALAECTQWREAAIRAIDGYRPAIVFVASSLNYTIMDANEHLSDAGAGSATWRDGMAELLQQLGATGARVVLMQETPHHRHDPLECLATATQVQDCTPPRSELVDDRYQAFERTSVAAAGAMLMPTIEWLCQPETCAPILGHYIVYRNPGHLTATIAAVLAAQVRWQLDHGS